LCAFLVTELGVFFFFGVLVAPIDGIPAVEPVDGSDSPVVWLAIVGTIRPRIFLFPRRAPKHVPGGRGGLHRHPRLFQLLTQPRFHILGRLAGLDARVGFRRHLVDDSLGVLGRAALHWRGSLRWQVNLHGGSLRRRGRRSAQRKERCSGEGGEEAPPIVHNSARQLLEQLQATPAMFPSQAQ
jgi:hypothetical protein